MNPASVFLLVAGVALLPAALLAGGHQGLTLLGVLFVVLAMLTQIIRPRARKDQQ